jgi:hypothetical protein
MSFESPAPPAGLIHFGILKNVVRVDLEFPLNPAPNVIEIDADAFSAGKHEGWNQIA